MSLILASSSPWKLDVLRRLGLDVVGVPHRVDESTIAFGADPESAVRRLAEAKALSVSRPRGASDRVLGADQIMVLEGETFGKAADAGAARRVLDRMQGRRHRLLSGWALSTADRVIASGVEEVRLRMRALTDEQIRRYVETDEWKGMAGCYRFEGVGRQLFDEVDGDYFAILGMPVKSLLPVLRHEGVEGLI
jgi:septum formation protein